MRSPLRGLVGIDVPIIQAGMSIFGGQSAGLIQNVEPAGAIVRALVAETRASLAGGAQFELWTPWSLLVEPAECDDAREVSGPVGNSSIALGMLPARPG